MSRSPSFSLKVDSHSKVDLIALKRWVVAFCIIRFDLEQGQVIEECYPPGSLTQDEELEIALSSFPDSMSHHHNRSSIHDCIFFFRFRKKDVPSLNSDHKELRGQNSGLSPSSRYIYGYVFNRQRQDERLKRGGEQKSIVILSHHPYLSVFKPLLQILGPLCFDVGKKVLEHVSSYVSLWPSPLPGKSMELLIGNATLKVYLPPAHSLSLELGDSIEDESFSSLTSLPPTNQSIPQGLFHESNLFGIFRGLLLQLWLLWELLMIGEPILIISPTPSQCCEAVASLVSLLAPLLCSMDFRPYFTIHDSDFAQLNSHREGDQFPSMILGVTNLFFLKSLRSIPHIVSVGCPVPNSSRSSPSLNSTTNTKSLGSVQLNNWQQSLKKYYPSRLLNSVKMRRDGPLCLMTEHKEAVWSSYAAITRPDTSVLNRLVDTGNSSWIEESMSVVNNEILRRHFFELTTNFLAPFGPYFRPTVPLEGVSPFTEPSPLPVFNINEFLGGLSARGPGKFLSKRMRANWLDLYRRFLKGQNFMPWFERRRAVAKEEEHKLWRQARMKCDIHQYLSRMTELEIVDSFNTIERHLLHEMQSLQSDEGYGDFSTTCQKLKGDLQAVFEVLPKDMQQLLLSNPQRAALLPGGLDQKRFPGHPLRIEVVPP